MAESEDVTERVYIKLERGGCELYYGMGNG